MMDGLLLFSGGLQMGLGIGAYITWRYLRSQAKNHETVELMRPLVGALVAMGTGDIGPASIAIQNLTRKAAEDVAALQVAEQLKHDPALTEEPRSGVTITRGLPAWPYGTGNIGRPSYDETEDTPEQETEGSS